MGKALLLPFHDEFRDIRDIPHTISYVIRKRQQIDNLNELPKEKRPPERILWHNNPDLLEDWIDKVFDKKNTEEEKKVQIPLSEIEG